MQRAVYQQATFIHGRTSRVSGHGAGIGGEAANDDSFQEQPSVLKLVLSVLANVVGGTLLLSAMFVMPHIIARMFA